MQNEVNNEFTESRKEPLLPYYVYLLLNPLDHNRVFYVGKGTGQRAGAHYNDVNRLLKQLAQESEDQLTKAELTSKQAVVRNIAEAGKKPLEVIVGRYETEQEAFAVEATLLHFLYGKSSLTNIASGRRHRYIRTKEEFEEIVKNARDQENIPRKAGVDEEKVTGLRTNEYRNQKILGLEEASAYDTLAELQQILTENGFVWRDFNEPGDRYFHPGESNGYLAVIVNISGIDFNVQFTKKLKFSIQYIYTKDPSENEQPLKNLQEKLDLVLGKAKAGRKYSWLKPDKKYRNIPDIPSLLKVLESLRGAMEV
ncbi:hypothetical protein GH984_02830 [Spiribacter sp. C176]|uniref:GIY-YIG domain-containing protein n=1 Tax=Spiribacter salilacus TaxID=2664894 RepID=A0A6N7QQG8_9GAMM|nr:hypothetical protein [Spiribacter salilacus]MRH77633.1 hypothetical protein [Spiribacter salilacus]